MLYFENFEISFTRRKFLDSFINSVFELYNLFNWNIDFQIKNILRRKI
jgi:hypothetical protein